MSKTGDSNKTVHSAAGVSCGCEDRTDRQQLPVLAKAGEPVCCGVPPGPPSTAVERPGYQLYHFVKGFLETPAGPVPQVKTRLERVDTLGTISARFGFQREGYKIAPGLYGVGDPGDDSMVLVTANYKLSFDALRKELDGVDAWILVLDTRGINVWCAAGKGLFSTEDVIRQVQTTRLKDVVKHRELLLPQLSATGVSSLKVKKGCGFKVIWGPIRARDLKRFVDNGLKAETYMRRATFTMSERLVLVPVELSLLRKPALWALVIIFLLSGIGPSVFSFSSAWSRGIIAVWALAVGIFTGATLTPALLPWLPGTSFSLKGGLAGLLGGMAVILTHWKAVGVWEGWALLCLTVTVSSYLAMNFTGSTPFTSPSGVEKEMRRAIPLQAAVLLAAILVWVGTAFAQ